MYSIWCVNYKHKNNDFKVFLQSDESTIPPPFHYHEKHPAYSVVCDDILNIMQDTWLPCQKYLIKVNGYHFVKQISF